MSDLDIVLRLQEASSRVLDWIMFFFTQLGDETFFLLVAIIIFWCIDKRFGYKFIVVFMLGQLFTGVLKTAFKRARPFSVGAKAVIARSGGYSFPSGHSQNIANIATQTTIFCNENCPSNKKTVAILGACAVAVVMLTRIYLGQHYLTDVVAGAALGVIVAVIFTKLFDLLKNNEERLMFIILPLTVLLTVVLMNFSENVAKVLGALGAVSLGYYLEKRYVCYNVKNSKFIFNFIKVLLGGAVLFALKEGIKHAVSAQGHWLFLLNYLRYFLLAFVASFVAPMVFKKLKI